jgi:drug/metabolite transporter (DMT)-like permease
MFISVNPLWAAVMGRVLLKEKMEWPTVVALVVALSAIALVFVPSIVNDGKRGENDGSVRGDVISLVCGTCVAVYLTANRRASSMHPKALMSVAGVMGSFLAAVLCLLPALALQLGSHVHTLEGHHAGAVHLNPGLAHAFTDLEPLFWPLILIDSAMIVGCIITAMTLAPRYISATQVALLLLLGALSSRPPSQVRRTHPLPTLPRFPVYGIRLSKSKPRRRQPPMGL